MSRLPPFDALLAFDAAVRHGSMTLAAGELGITQSAISHRLKRLEAFMGTTLLNRHNTGLLPTPAGEMLIEGLKDLLDNAAELRARCQLAAAPNRLRVGTHSALADHWLVRRLPEFAAAHPHISVELVVVDNHAPDRSANLDVRLLWVPFDEARSTSTQMPLFRERVFPVCHPTLVPPGHVFGDPRVLLKMPLLHKGAPGRDQGTEWAWSSWFERLGLPGTPKVALRFDSLGPAMAAALQGSGAVISRSMLAHDALANGQLVRLLPPQHDMPSGKAHVVRWLLALRGDPRLKSFTDWLVEKAKASCDSCEWTTGVSPPPAAPAALPRGTPQRAPGGAG